MPSFGEYGLFCVGAAALVVSPGPDFFYVASRALGNGRAAGVVSALGIGSGLVLHTALAASGISLLLLSSNWAFNALKFAGALYLIWMGIGVLRARSGFGARAHATKISRFMIWRQGVLTNVFNPKVALTFAAFLTPFVHPERSGATLGIVFLGATLCVLATGWFCLVGLFAGKTGALLERNPRLARAVPFICAAILCGLGARLAFLTRA